MATIQLKGIVRTAWGNFATARFRRGSMVLLPRRPYAHNRKKGDNCPCKCWLWNDWSWTHDLVPQEQWRAALKRPHMSAYDLWMHESVYLAANGSYLPDAPSRSGGWSNAPALPGTRLQPPYQCIRHYTTFATAEAQAHIADQIEYKLTAAAADPRRHPTGIYSLTIEHYGQGYEHPPTQSWPIAPPAGTIYAYAPDDALNLWAAIATANDGTYHRLAINGELPDSIPSTGSKPTFSHRRQGPWQ